MSVDRTPHQATDLYTEAVVIGAGMGGLCVAAYLAAQGKRVTVVEKTPYPGGRCSHRSRQDCLVTTGALMIPMGSDSAIRQAFDAVGAEMDMVDITGRMRYRLAHGDYDLPPGGGGLYGMIEFAMGDEASARQLFGRIRDALSGWMPLDTISIRDWLDQYTDNQSVKKMFQGYCAALMGTSLHEIPAGEFFRFLKYSSKGSRFGLARHGNGALMESLVRALGARGAQVRYRARCQRILVENGAVLGVGISNERGEEETIRAGIVVSNIGPDQTVALAGGDSLFESSYIARLRSHPMPAPIYHISFIMERPLVDNFEGCLVFCNNRNLVYLEIPSAISPGTISPPGRYLHTAYGAPSDATDPELSAELENTLRELEQNFPGMLAEAQVLVKAKFSGNFPGMRRWAGYGMPVKTPINGLYNVGDGCAPPGTIGTESAAASARVVAEMIAGSFSGR